MRCDQPLKLKYFHELCPILVKEIQFQLLENSDVRLTILKEKERKKKKTITSAEVLRKEKS